MSLGDGPIMLEFLLIDHSYIFWFQVALVSSIWFGCPIFVSFLSFTENIIGSFFNDPFSILIVFDNLFFNFIVCIFGTVAGYILIIGVSLLEIELLLFIVIEWVLNSFQ